MKQKQPKSDPNRFSFGPSGVVPVGRVTITDNLTEAQKRDNAEHDAEVRRALEEDAEDL